MQANQQYIPRVHNLLKLLDLCLPFEPALFGFQDLLAQLDHYSVQYRYPGESADKDEARAAFKLAQQFRDLVRNLTILTEAFTSE